MNWLFVTPLAVAAVLVPIGLVGGSQSIDSAVSIAGLVLGLGGVVLRVVARDWKVTYSDGALVMTGPYSVMRHPMYVGSFLMGLGLCLIMGSLIFTAAFVVIYVALHTWVAHGEERYLTGLFPEEYDRFRSSVPGCIPSPFRLIGKIAKVRQWMELLRRGIGRETGAACGFLAGAALLQARKEYIVHAKTLARGDVAVPLALAALVCVVWAIDLVRKAASK